MNPFKEMQWFRRKAAEPKPEPPRSVVEQIEALLQARLASSPFSGRSIHMIASPDGGARITVDGRTYDGVADVPDPAVRVFIESVVSDWERAV